MSFLQWNCKGLRSRSEQFKVLLHDCNPGVVCLQETQLGNEVYNPGLNYAMYTSVPPPGNRAHGGAAIIVKKSLQHSPITLNTMLQAVAVTVILRKPITVCSLYLPPGCGFDKGDIELLISQLPSPFFILGDFSAHNPLWGGNILDNAGKVIDDIIQNNNITLYNDGSMTYHNI